MSEKRMGRKEERRLAAYFEAHTDDADEWESEPAKLERVSKGGMVYSLRLTAQELTDLRSLSELEGIRMSDLIREALKAYMANKKQARHGLVRDVANQWVLAFHGPAVSSGLKTYGIRTVQRQEWRGERQLAGTMTS